MAKDTTRGRKKVTRQVAEGVAHIHASFNNTIVTITDRQGNAFLGQPLVVRVSVVRVSPLRLLLRLQRKLLARRLRNTV